MNKLISISLILCSCIFSVSPKSEVVADVEDIDEPKCFYRYFLNDKHELDSTIVECPDIHPPRPMRIHPLRIDSIRNWNIG